MLICTALDMKKNIKFFHPLVQNVNPGKAVSTDAKMAQVLQPPAVAKRRKNWQPEMEGPLNNDTLPA